MKISNVLVLILILISAQFDQIQSFKGIFRSSSGKDALGSALLGYVMASNINSNTGTSPPSNPSIFGDTFSKNPMLLPLLLSGSGGKGGLSNTMGLMMMMNAMGSSNRNNQQTGGQASNGGQLFGGGDMQTLTMLGLATGNLEALAPLALLQMANNKKSGGIETNLEGSDKEKFLKLQQRLSNAFNSTNTP